MQQFQRSVALTAVFAITLAVAPMSAAESGAVPQGTLSPSEIVRRLEAAGYKNVHDVEFEDGRYEAEATSAAGTAVDLDIDPVSGQVTKEDPD